MAIGGTAIDALVDLSVPEAVVRPDAGSATIRAYEVIPDSVYRAILVPQQATLTVSVSFGNGETRTETIENASLESGRSYNLPVVVSDDSALKIEVGLSGEIADWVDGGELTGSGNTDGEDPDLRQLLHNASRNGIGITYLLFKIPYDRHKQLIKYLSRS